MAADGSQCNPPNLLTLMDVDHPPTHGHNPPNILLYWPVPQSPPSDDRSGYPPTAAIALPLILADPTPIGIDFPSSMWPHPENILIP